MTTSIEIIGPGVHTTVQDLGRAGRRHAGLARGGAVDPVSLRIANLLVGNDEGAAGLECALIGPTIRFSHDTTIALSGAESTALAPATRVRVRARQTIRIGHLSRFAYAYLAIAGGIDVPIVAGSRSTDTRIGWGGHEGRRLARGDTLSIGPAATPPDRTAVSVSMTIHLSDDSRPIRFLPGIDAQSVDHGWSTRSFRISSRSDRMGLRLEGTSINCASRSDGASSIILPGTIQLPPDGNPIVLLADAQTLGGYPQIAHVIGVDLPRLAQRPPGSVVRFAETTLDEAHRLTHELERELAFLRYGLSLRP